MRKSLIIGLGIIGFTASTFAAPVPGSTNAANPKLGLYASPLGFKISASDTDWIQTEPPPKTKYIVTMYKSPQKFKDTQASLTVRVDKLEKRQALRSYVDQWLKDYPKFGFDVLGSKPFETGKQKGYVIDLVSRSSQKQLRQVVFMKDDKAVILTCRDHQENFKHTLKSCNSIIKSFQWASAN